jgi:hypothetical protein
MLTASNDGKDHGRAAAMHETKARRTAVLAAATLVGCEADEE